MNTWLLIITHIVAVLAGMYIGSLLYAIRAIKKIDGMKWEHEKAMQDTITKLSNEIYDLMDMVEYIKLAVKRGKLSGKPDHQILELCKIINDWKSAELKEAREREEDTEECEVCGEREEGDSERPTDTTE